MTDAARSEFVYVTYIRTTPEKLWQALTTPELMRRYWFGMTQDTDWQVGSAWRLSFADGRVADTGEVLECDPPRRLRLRWRNAWKEEMRAEGDAICTIELEPRDNVVKLTLVHGMDRPQAKLIGAVSGGWPMILSNLKSWLETGEVALDRMWP